MWMIPLTVVLKVKRTRTSWVTEVRIQIITECTKQGRS